LVTLDPVAANSLQTACFWCQPGAYGAPVSPDRRRWIGRRGETVAAELLERLGFTLLERNYRTRSGEIDLIVSRDGTLVFCEVKALVGRPGGASAGPVTPLEAVGPAKRAQVRRLAREWLASERDGASRVRWQTIRFDVIGIVLRPDGSVTMLEHVEDAF
jgi:putative endonuclease